MRHLHGNERHELSGVDEVSELYESPDGGLYEWVDGLSAWGEPVGFWQGVDDGATDGSAVAGLGAFYQASDGSLYQMQGLADEEGADADAGADGGGEAADDADDGADASAPKMGPGRRGEVRVGPDGKRYRWVAGMTPGGKRTGFWRRIRPRAAVGARAVALRRPGGGPPPRAAARPAGPPPRGQRPTAAGGRKRKPFLKRLLPLAKVAASLIPVPGAGAAVRAGLTVADKLLTKKKPGMAGAGLGALYAAPDGTVYQVQGIADDDLQGLYDPETVDGVADGELDGLADADELSAVDDGDNLGADVDSATPSVAGEDALEGYVRDVPARGLEAYVPDAPPKTPMFDPDQELPGTWKPLW